MTATEDRSLSEDDIASAAQSEIRTSVQDEGIGGYEFWGARGNDVNWCLVLEDDELLVAADGLTEDDVPEDVRTTLYSNDEDGEFSLPVKLTFTGFVEKDGERLAVYSVTENA